VKPEEDETVWWIPLGIKMGPELAEEQHYALVAKSQVVRNISDDFYKINKDQAGFYRTNYPPHRLAKLGQSLHLLSTEDKIGLVADAAALAVSGEGSTAALLALLENFGGEGDYLLALSHSLRLSSALISTLQGLVSNFLIASQSSLCFRVQ
jgi:aminopeptidase N